MMRGWRSTFLFGGLAAALGLSPWLVGCAATPYEPGDDLGEEVAEVSSDLDYDSPENDPGGEDVADPAPPSGGESSEPDPVPWRPASTVAATSEGVPTPPAETDTEPDPIPWTLQGSDDMRARTDKNKSVIRP